MHCLSCGYRLDGLPEHRCPECGRDFDAGDRHTWARRPPPGPVDGLFLWGRHAPLLWLPAVALAGGVIHGTGFADFTAVTVVVLLVIAVVWCARDGVHRERPISTRLALGVFFLPVIFLPHYLFVTRRGRGVFALVIALLLLWTCVGLYRVGAGLGGWVVK